MNTIRAISGFFVWILLCGVATAQALTPDEVGRDSALAREAFERVHPGYTRFTDAAALSASWQGIVDDARRLGGMSTDMFYLRVQATLSLIRCDHTKAELPAPMTKARRTAPVYLPLRYSIVEGRALVQVADASTGIGPLEEIIAIDGQSITALIERFGPLISVDGYTDHVRTDELAQSSEFPGGGIEHFMALEGVTPTATLTVADLSGATREVAVARVGLDVQQAIVDPSPRASNFADAVTLDLRDHGVAVLTVDTFVNYRNPVDPDDVYAPLFRSLKKANVSRLIVDLRHNGGGSDDARDRLFAHLITQRASISREVQVKTLDLSGLKTHLSTWEPRALNPSRWWFKKLADDRYRLRGWLFGNGRHIKPARDAFDGEVIVLSSTGNSSGSTMLIASLQSSGRATVVGQRTGGNVAGPTAGVLFFLTLPNSQLRLRLPAQRIITGLDPQDRGRGVVPDVEVTPGVNDVRAVRDVVMARALLLPR